MFTSPGEVPLPSAGPSSPPRRLLWIADEWLPLISGLVEYMLWRGYWDGDDDDVSQGRTWALELIDMIEESMPDNVGICAYQSAVGTNRGASVAGYNARYFNVVLTSAPWMGLSGSQVTLLPGTYRISIQAPARGANQHRLRLRDSINTTTYQYGVNEDAAAVSGVVNVNNCATLDCVRVITSAATLIVEHYITTALASNGLGRNLNVGTEVETYETITINRLA